MDDVLNQAYKIVQCKECPWYKQCVTPMKFTAEDLKRQLEQNKTGMGIPGSGAPGDDNFISSMANAAQNSLLEGCPVFIDRLRSNPDLGLKLKKLMQEWGSENSPEK